jgi:hypothetical protein
MRWTKKLDEVHLWVFRGNETLCGRPMLGNNYARYFEKQPNGEWFFQRPDTWQGMGLPDRGSCQECWEQFVAQVAAAVRVQKEDGA